MAATDLDRFRTALASATRAIARDSAADVVFAGDSAGTTGRIARVVSPGAGLEPRLVAEARGAADSTALRLRFHDGAVHAAMSPGDAEARAVFDALETARVEALGSRTMAGVRANLDRHVEARVRGDAIGRARSAEEVPLATAVGLIARQRLTGAEPPAAAAAGLALVRPWIEEKAGAELDALALTIDDQKAFGEMARRLLEDLDLEAAADPTEQEPDDGGDDEAGEDDGPDDGDDNDTAGGSDGGELEMRGETSDQDEGDEDQSERDSELDDGDASTGEDGEQARGASARRNWLDEPAGDYAPFTTRYDEVVAAADLCDEEELARLRAYLDQQMASLSGVVTRLANRLQRRLMAQQARSWDFDQEEGMLDAARLARVVVCPATACPTRSSARPSSRIRWSVAADRQFRVDARAADLDRGDVRRHSRADARAVRGDERDFGLHHAGVEGRAEPRGVACRGAAAAAGAAQRPSPHRLQARRRTLSPCAQESRADDARGAAQGEYRRRGIAVGAPAAARRPEERRILMVISDGAPVDDSTASANGGTYLERHLREVIGWIETRSSVELSAIGIGHDVTRYYRRAVTIMDAEALGGALIEQLADLFDQRR